MAQDESGEKGWLYSLVETKAAAAAVAAAAAAVLTPGVERVQKEGTATPARFRLRPCIIITITVAITITVLLTLHGWSGCWVHL